MVGRYAVPHRLFDDVIDGQRQDLDPQPFHTFQELSVYCYRVAGVVGLASIYIWGFTGGAKTEALAVKRGTAFQLTNILRDLRADAAAGRAYIPEGELAAAGIGPDDLKSGRAVDGFVRLMRAQVERAEAFYEQSRGLEDRVHREARPTLIAMTEIYRGLLRKIAAEPERTLRERISLSTLHKLRIGWRASRAR
jgi:15-cis-phytoene synthase